MSLTTTSDSELLELFRNPVTKERAYTSIIKKYQEKLYWHIRRMVVEHEDANDVLQNVLIRIWNGLEKFREDSQLYTWLYRIATNECLTYLEQQKKRSSVSLSDVESGLSNKIMADKHFDSQKASYSWLIGETTLKERNQEVLDFGKKEDIQTFLISLKAGGTGLNLTAADYVFILDPWWNPSVEEQAIARAHRIGQAKTVMALKFITRDTIEEKILQLQERKKQLVADILDFETMPNLMREDLAFLLS